MDYIEARAYITEKEKLGSVFGLEGIRELLKRLGNPEKFTPAIHIAGTNGKGSIMAYVEETFIKAGMTVGRYISPTIFDYRERWTRNKEWASREDIAKAITITAQKVEEMVADGLPSPTAFEIETAVAFLLFKYWQCDVMLIECGMGGRLDATNVLEMDVLNVLASISMDHMSVLGNTLKDITREKLGIVRDKTVLVSYPQCEEVMQEVREYCILHNVKLIAADTDELVINEQSLHSASFTYKGEDYDISIGGEYQIYNAITAIEVLKYFREVCEDSIYMGLLTTQWSGRFSIVHNDPLVIVDGAHNEDAWIQLSNSLEKHFKDKRLIFVMGVFKDKEYSKMIEMLSPRMAACYTVCSDNPRSFAPEELADTINKSMDENVAIPVGDVDRAIDMAVERAKETGESIIVCGTLSITGAALRHFE